MQFNCYIIVILLGQFLLLYMTEKTSLILCRMYESFMQAFYIFVFFMFPLFILMTCRTFFFSVSFGNPLLDVIVDEAYAGNLVQKYNFQRNIAQVYTKEMKMKKSLLCEKNFFFKIPASDI